MDDMSMEFLETSARYLGLSLREVLKDDDGVICDSVSESMRSQKTGSPSPRDGGQRSGAAEATCGG
ncbi:hypothetical protein I8N54_11250 [Pelagovum pacificum]|nr:hypothetical protein I8N54_11250 [Pelagovum pacificum]